MNQTMFRVLFAAGVVGALALLAPVIVSAVTAGAGLLALGVIGVVGFGIIQFLPALGQKLENAVLKVRKNEARSNPIEQLQNFLQQKAEQVADFKAAVTNIGSQIKTLQGMVAQRKKERPGYDSSAQEKSIQSMVAAHTLLVSKYVNAEKALEELKLAIQDKEFEWKFSQAGQKAIQSLNSTSGKELLDAMLADEAFSSVTENFNAVFAELELEAVHLSESKQLTFDQGLTIDLTQINLTDKEPKYA